jgi:hypothetical protein
MATKTQVINLLKKQKAEWEIESRDPFTFSAWLPNGLIWDSGYGCGLTTQELQDGKTMSDFWDSLLSVIDAEVVADK